nr:cell wall protein DAN4-like [Aegilops tauschii subsp. strangulata]
MVEKPHCYMGGRATVAAIPWPWPRASHPPHPGDPQDPPCDHSANRSAPFPSLAPPPLRFARARDTTAATSSIPRPPTSPRRAKASKSCASFTCFDYEHRLRLGGPERSPSGVFPASSRRFLIPDLLPQHSPGLPSTSSRTATPRLTLMPLSMTTSTTTPPSCQSNQMLEPRSQTPPSMTTPTTPEVPTTTCSPLTTTSSS